LMMPKFCLATAGFGGASCGLVIGEASSIGIFSAPLHSAWGVCRQLDACPVPCVSVRDLLSEGVRVFDGKSPRPSCSIAKAPPMALSLRRHHNPCGVVGQVPGVEIDDHNRIVQIMEGIQVGGSLIFFLVPTLKWGIDLSISRPHLPAQVGARHCPKCMRYR
jgi:hypothetical protein